MFVPKVNLLSLSFGRILEALKNTHELQMAGSHFPPFQSCKECLCMRSSENANIALTFRRHWDSHSSLLASDRILTYSKKEARMETGNGKKN